MHSYLEACVLQIQIISKKKKNVWKRQSLSKSILNNYHPCLWERSGSVVERLTWDRGAAGSSLIGVTALCPWARHINPSLVLVQPKKTPLYNWKIVDGM